VAIHFRITDVADIGPVSTGPYPRDLLRLSPTSSRLVWLTPSAATHSVASFRFPNFLVAALPFLPRFLFVLSPIEHSSDKSGLTIFIRLTLPTMTQKSVYLSSHFVSARVNAPPPLCCQLNCFPDFEPPIFSFLPVSRPFHPGHTLSSTQNCTAVDLTCSLLSQPLFSSGLQFLTFVLPFFKRLSPWPNGSAISCVELYSLPPPVLFWAHSLLTHFTFLATFALFS